MLVSQKPRINNMVHSLTWEKEVMVKVLSVMWIKMPNHKDKAKFIEITCVHVDAAYSVFAGK